MHQLSQLPLYIGLSQLSHGSADDFICQLLLLLTLCSIAALTQAAASPALRLLSHCVAHSQVVKYFEQILYATDESEARETMLEAQKLYAGSNGHLPA